MSCLVAKAQTQEPVRPVDGAPSCQSCMPVSVEPADKDKDADENVDAGQTRTG